MVPSAFRHFAVVRDVMAAERIVNAILDGVTPEEFLSGFNFHPPENVLHQTDSSGKGFALHAAQLGIQFMLHVYDWSMNEPHIPKGTWEAEMYVEDESSHSWDAYFPFVRAPERQRLDLIYAIQLFRLEAESVLHALDQPTEAHILRDQLMQKFNDVFANFQIIPYE